MSNIYLEDAMRTIMASRTELWVARIFGKKKAIETEEEVLTLRLWRGKSYLVDHEWKPTPPKEAGDDTN